MLPAATLRTELHALLDQAVAVADEQGLSRLLQVLSCLAEGAELATFTMDVPAGLEHAPALHRQILMQDLLAAEAAGRC